jgi:ankyrin repeat protein
MTTLRSLPHQPSLESLRKQAKKLAREKDLSLRDAQWMLAREYGFAGWQALRAEVLKRAGSGLEWAAGQAEQAIHDNDVERLKQLLTDYPAVVSWRDDFDRTLLDATTSFGDSTDPYREQMFNRPACTELLIDAGAEVAPSVWKQVLDTGAVGMLQLLWRKGVLPRTLPILASLGDLDGVRANLDDAVVTEAFLYACRFKRAEVAAVLLDRCIALDSDLGKRIDAWQGRAAFIDYLSEHPLEHAPATLWQSFVMRQLANAIHANDLPAFARWLQSDAYFLGASYVDFQVTLLEQAAFGDRGPFIEHLLALDPAILHCSSPPKSSALTFSLEYGNAHLVPLLTRIWPLPDDLPHAVGVGNFARVKRWFDDSGQPALGDPRNHHPGNNAQGRSNLHWGAPNVQQILDVALAWACMNRQLDIASFLLERGANINTTWSTHEPASILHECAFRNNYEAVQFLIDHGIDMTIRDYRWNATAEGWAYHAAKNEAMANFLAAAERRRQSNG